MWTPLRYAKYAGFSLQLTALLGLGFWTGLAADELVDEGWQAYRNGDYLKAEALLLKRLCSSSSAQNRTEVIERLAVLYVAMNLDDDTARKRLHGQDPIDINALSEAMKQKYVRDYQQSHQTFTPKTDETNKEKEQTPLTVSSTRDSVVRPPSVPTAETMLFKLRLSSSNELPPMEIKGLENGKVVGREQMKSLTDRNTWEKIEPQWSGTWESNSETILSGKDYLDYKVMGVFATRAGTVRGRQEVTDHTVVVRGFQKDKTGQIWTYTGPLNVVSTSALITTIHIVDSHQRSEDKDGRSLVRDKGRKIILSTGNNVVQATCQTESLKSSILLNPTAYRTDSSNRSFTNDGRLWTESLSTKAWTRIAPFRQTDVYDGKNMKLLFAAYLHKKGLGHLISR